MMRQHVRATSHCTQKCYNEVIIETATYVRQLPSSLEAIFMYGHDAEQASLARQTHQRFLAEYGLSARDVPLLRLNLGNHDAPFSDVSHRTE